MWFTEHCEYISDVIHLKSFEIFSNIVDAPTHRIKEVKPAKILIATSSEILNAK